MTTMEDIGEPEVSDDAISLTSTKDSETEDKYEVECILAEKKVRGVVKYLTKWKDYDETNHSWIPRENFDNEETLNNWENAKIRISEGLEQPFNVKAWGKRSRLTKEATALRRERRQLKKSRLASKLGDQGANIESSASKLPLKPSEKLIKRRNVHLEDPPSSSASADSSSPISDDSDRPLVSRQQSETSTWTQQETIALEEGLKLKGPNWTEILGMYGRDGTISQVLKTRNPTDLHNKAKSVHQEFVDSGREPPNYLKPFSRTTSSRGSRTATLDLHTGSRDQGRAVSKSRSRSTSLDSLMAELQEKEKRRTRTASNQEDGQLLQNPNSKESLPTAGGTEKQSDTAKNTSSDKSKARRASQASSRQAEIPESGRRVKGLPQIGASSKSERQLENPTPSRKDIADPDSTAVAPSGVSFNGALENSGAVLGDTARNTWSGTARASNTHPSVSAPSRRETADSGPNRSGSSVPKTKSGQVEPKKPRLTSDITAAWNAEPKRRKSNIGTAPNADPVDGQSSKSNFKYLSVQNKVFKSRRDGRAPDLKSLDLIDPKTGKPPPTVLTPSANVTISKTRLQLPREERAAKVADERQVQDGGNATRSNPSKRDPPPQNIDHTREITMEEQTAPKTGRPPVNSPPSALSPTNADTTDRPALVDTLNSSSAASSRPGIPANPPRGPKFETNRMATVAPPENTQHLKSPTDHLHEANANSLRPYSLHRPSMFTLRVYPSQEDKDELFHKISTNLVHGDIKLGENDQEIINVKLVGFGWEVQKLLLTIKIPPRTVEFVFKTVCLASEYKAFFPAETSDYLGSGSVIAYRSNASAVENLVETLANTLQGGLFFAQQYTMLIYPAGASVWAFLDDNLPTVHAGTSLRFVVRKPLPPMVADVDEVAAAQLKKIGIEQYTQLKAKIQNSPIQAEDKNINIVFRDMFEIDFGRLVAQNGPQQHPPTNIFFLYFIPQGCEDYEPDPAKRLDLRMRTSEEHDMFIKFLQANGAEEIYSLQNIGSQNIENNGAWDYFCKNVKSGTIIFHDAFIRYDLVPRLAKHLLHGSVNVWKASLSPMHPGEKHPYLVRLFPHGGVLLLTESLILYRPREALRLLMWFRLVHLPAKAPGTWKLAMRPRIREWLLDLLEAYDNSGKDIFGHSIQTFADIYTEIYRLLQRPNGTDNGLMCHSWDYELPLDEAPIVTSSSLRVLQSRREWKIGEGEGAAPEPDDDHIRQNDDLLTQWFAEWAIANLQSYRKFHVLLGYTKDDPFTDRAVREYEEAWGHVEVMTPETAFTRHKVSDQPKLDGLEADRRRRQREQLPAKRAAAAKLRKEERDAAAQALESRMQIFRDAGASAEQVLRAGRQLLSEMGASPKEIEECKVDMDRDFTDRWWDDTTRSNDNDGGRVNEEDRMDTS